MDCRDFLEHYSAFRDGLVTDREVAGRLRSHVRDCRCCARYHAAIARGVQALKREGDLEPSPQFRRALRLRLAQAAARPEPLMPAQAGLVAALLLAATIALLVWDASGGSPRPPTRPLAAQNRPHPVVLANPGLPFVSFGERATKGALSKLPGPR